MAHLQKLPVVALVTTGRTGADFLQSLLDSHPQAATFNGHFAVYSEFFSRALTFSVPGALAADAADEFIGQYLYKLVSCYDIQEAKDCLGEDSSQSFRTDTAEFKAHVVGLMGDLPLNSRNFLFAVYGAYNLCLGQKIEEFRVLFHHPHLDYEFRLFVRDFPGTRVIFSSRDPRANFCSHVEHFRLYYKTHDNQQHILNCLKMALEDSELADEFGLDYTATRLEDLPREDVVRDLATWLGIDYRESMLRSTWAGLDWHGDRISAKKFSAQGGPGRGRKMAGNSV
ncbi:MAG: sulfotransferase [Betaproteobacteria bacterium]|nr:sulfotransferase [Betaproteobacteria bacterium]